MHGQFRHTRHGNWRVALIGFITGVATVLAGGGRPALALGTSGHSGRFLAIATAGDHTLALAADGTVWAWGLNDGGQLGDGTMGDPNLLTNRSTPLQVAGLTDVVAIAAGLSHSLALKANGTVWAWGFNNYGQLGDTTTANRATPVPVNGLNGVAAIAAGANHSLALKPDGTLWAWGDNYAGQLGDGTNDERHAPVAVAGLAGVVSVTSGGDHTLAIKSDGTLWAWGANSKGQLGDGTTNDAATPTPVSGLSAVAAAAGGLTHSLAVRSDGSVWAWGDNARGALGDGSNTDRLTPAQVPGFSSATAVAAGEHSLVRKADGSVWAWGANTYGQVGDGTTTDRNSPVPVAGLNGVVAVAASYLHSVVLKSDQTLWSWGSNIFSHLGTGTPPRLATPAQLAGQSAGTAMAAGEAHSAVRKSDGTVLTTGYNDGGQLGGATAVRKELAVVPGLNGVTAIAAGRSFMLAAKADGTMAAWGDNGAGNLGDGTTLSRGTPVAVSGLAGVAAVAAHWRHSLALKADGTVWAWGYNFTGQLGDGTTVNRSTPVQVQGLGGVTALAANVNTSVALKADGTVWAWGWRVGDGTAMNRLTPVQVPGLAGVVAIAASYGHALVLKSDGSVWAWGANATGQLGDGTTTTRLSPVQVTGLGSVSAIGAGWDHSLAVDSDGSVRAWGKNQFGQLGDGSFSDRLTPVQVPGLTEVAAVTGGRSYTLALKSDGTVWGWGANDWGQYGADPAPWLTQPARVYLNASPDTPAWNAPAASSSHQGTVAFSATAIEPDGESYAATFELHGNATYTNLVRTITGATVAAGAPSTATWSVDLAAGAYYARVRAADANGGVSAWQPLGQIQIVTNQAPAAPAGLTPGGNGWLATRTPALAWTFSDSDNGDTQGAFQVIIKDGAGTTIHDSGQVSGTGGSYAVPPGVLTDGGFSWSVRTWDSQGSAGPYAAESLFRVDTTAPTAMAAALAAYQTSRSFAVGWTATDGAGNASVKLYYSTDGGGTWVQYGAAFAVSPIAFTAPGDGLYAFSVRGLDLAGNEEAAPAGAAAAEATTLLTTSAPVGAVTIAGGAAATAARTVVLSLSAAAPGINITEMRFADDGAAWTAWEPYATVRSYLLPAGDGVKTVTAQFRDAAGNLSATVAASILLDTIAPAGSAAPLAATESSATVPVAWTASDGNGAGVTGVHLYYSGDGGDTWIRFGGTFTASPIAFAAPADGAYAFSVVAVDGAGNAEPPPAGAAEVEATTTVLAIAPTGTIVINGGNSTTRSAAVALTLAAGPAVVEMRFSGDGATWGPWESFATVRSYALPAAAGVYTVYVQFRNAAGLAGAVASTSISREEEPLPRGAVIINAGAPATPVAEVQLTVLLWNAPEGAVQMRFSNDRVQWMPWEAFAAERAFTLPAGHGRHMVWVQFRDSAGNYLISANYGILVDLQPPHGVVVAEGAPAAGSWTRLHVLAADIGAGVPYVRFSTDAVNWGSWHVYGPVHLFNAPEGAEIYAQFRDLAGNLSAVVRAEAATWPASGGATGAGAAADTTPPTGTLRLIAVAAEKEAGDVLLVQTAADTQSPVTAMRFSRDAVVWTTWQPFVPVRRWFMWNTETRSDLRVQLRDAAGNVSEPIRAQTEER